MTTRTFDLLTTAAANEEGRVSREFYEAHPAATKEALRRGWLGYRLERFTTDLFLTLLGRDELPRLY